MMSPSTASQEAALPSVRDLATWREALLDELKAGTDTLDERCAAFPYSSVLGTFHQFGKEFVPGEYLQCLDELDGQLSALDLTSRSPEHHRLRAFFGVLLDKHRQQYCYDSYIGSRIIEQAMALPDMAFEDAWRERTRQVVGMMADIVQFECLTYLGEMPRQTAHLNSRRAGCKRIHAGVHALKIFGAAVPDLFRDTGIEALAEDWKKGETEGAPELLRRTALMAHTVIGRLSDETRQMIALTMVPVSTAHDEFMFIRIVQAFEMMFLMLASGFRETISRLSEHRMTDAVASIRTMTNTLRTSLPFFRVLNTMPSENFMDFRDMTDGASAIQSQQYKWIEVLAAHPSTKRIHSEGFEPVPAVKQAYRQGLRNIEDAFYDCRRNGSGAPAIEECRAALLALDKYWVAWKRSHVNTVIRALGAVKGTGGTAGLVYLQRYATTRLFPFLYRVDEPETHADAALTS